MIFILISFIYPPNIEADIFIIKPITPMIIIPIPVILATLINSVLSGFLAT